MVSEPADKRKAVEKAGNTAVKTKKSSEGGAEGDGNSALWWIMLLVFVTALVVTALIGLVVSSLLGCGANNEEVVMGECPGMGGVVMNSNECVAEATTVEKIDFQSMVDEWAEKTGGKKGVIIYDLAAGAVAGEYNADSKFETASIYKLFVVYAGYMKVDSGEWDASDMAGVTGQTIGTCLDLAIRESDSECAETLWEMIGRDELDVVVQEEFGLSNVEVGSLTATPREAMKIMLKYYQHSEITNDELVAVMKDSFLNQPVTTYDWRMGLPSGFSESVRVYNKVGWNYDGTRWLIYNDAAIVDFADSGNIGDGRDFIVVVMTSGVDFKDVRRLGENFERYFLQQ